MGGVSVATSEVHTHREVDLAAAHNVLKERVGLRYRLEEVILILVIIIHIIFENVK